VPRSGTGGDLCMNTNAGDGVQSINEQETHMTHSRFDRLNASLRTSDLDAVILNPGPTLTYLSGLHFHLMERPVVLLFAQDQDPAIVLPELELQKVASLPYKLQVFSYPENPSEWDSAFRKAVQALGLDGKRIGVEPRQLRLLEFRHVKAGAPEADYPDASEVLSGLRLKKDQAEVDAMRRAVKIAQDALEATMPFIKIGMTERELSSELVVHLLKHGSEPEMPFSPIVSGGPNSANPHASPTERKLQAGDLLVVDWGAVHEGYISDLTRTFAVGEVDAEYEKIHKIVQEANAAGRAAGKPGVPCANVDKAARDVIERAGYGAYFTHRTGHGIGMEGHEEPYMRGDNMQLLEPGMAFTVEPGIYLPGRNGVRIEDNVVITETGVDVLSDMPREIRVVG
jgi:Xaa-Pro dipeptidase